MRPRIYLAGPEVFRPDAQAEGARLKALCDAQGLEGVYPLDHAVAGGPPLTEPDAIRRNCIAQLGSVHAVLANISPFRGHHMDPGTAWEIGYAQARGLPVFLWSSDARPMRHRVPAAASQPELRDADGYLIEDFDRTENIMIVPGGAPVRSSPEEALNDAGTLLRRDIFARELQRTTRRSVLIGLVIAILAALVLGTVVNRIVGW